MPDFPTEPSARPSLRDLAAQAEQTEIPAAALCVKLARACLRAGRRDEAFGWLARVADCDGPYVAWASAAGVLDSLVVDGPPPCRRSVRVALAGSYTTAQLGALLRVAALRRGIHVELYEAGFGAYAQELLDPDGPLYAFAPDYVIIAPHEGAVAFGSRSEDPERELADEVARWQGLWSAVAANCTARVIQHNIAVRPESAWGHVAARTAGSRDEMLRTLNTRLAAAAGEDVVIVDCDRVAAGVGKARWFDDRYWHLAKQAVALDALPQLARHTAALLAAAEGLSSKCVVVDLDNTLWGGVIAEDELTGIRLGDGPQGEAHVAFQEYLLALRARGILLAVVSKNNEADARLPFERHPDMRLAMSDFAAFLADWTDKATNLRRVADQLNLGLDALVFIDDNPAERQVVRRLAPEVEVVALPADPAGYVRALSDTLLLETVAVTGADLARAEQYRARSAASELARSAGSLGEFLDGLQMQARIGAFDELDLSRIVQLIAKTNQFNLTTRRHSRTAVEALMADPDVVTLSLRLRDRFGDHGLVALLIARQDGDVLDLDTWLMSCRVIGRSVENAMLARLCETAIARGAQRIRGTFVATPRNAVVRDLYPRLGFAAESRTPDGPATFVYDIIEKGVALSDHIDTTDAALAS